MAEAIVNYDGSISTTPARIAYPESVQDLQDIMRNGTAFPSPVRPKASFHSLTPCVSTDGTLVDMSHMTRIISIEPANQLFTAQAGLQLHRGVAGSPRSHQ
jgi:FAD/FMN-containing dehydrogenase